MINTLQDHLNKNGLNERTHGNTGRISKTERIFVDTSITFPLKEFLIKYGKIHGLPSPLRHRNDSETFIYLLIDKTIKSIYNKYKDHYYIEHNKTVQIISYYTF
jgi:hypothetical protein